MKFISKSVSEMKITIISGTDRPGSLSDKVSNFVCSKYQDSGVQSNVASMTEFPLSSVAGGKYGKDIPEVKAFNNQLLDSDGWVMVIPEYNGSFPGILKLFVDYLPFPGGFNGKPISFIGEGDGSFGGLRAVEQMQMVASYRDAHIFPERVFIPRVRKNFDEDEGIKDEMVQSLLNKQISGFIDYIHRLSAVAEDSEK